MGIYDSAFPLDIKNSSGSWTHGLRRLDYYATVVMAALVSRNTQRSAEEMLAAAGIEKDYEALADEAVRAAKALGKRLEMEFR